MKLEKAIHQVAKLKREPMRVAEPTGATNEQQLSIRNNGSAMCDFPSQSRSFNRTDLF